MRLTQILISAVFAIHFWPSQSFASPKHFEFPKFPSLIGSQLVDADKFAQINGGMSGGGGELLEPATDADVWEIIGNTRTELILFFTHQSRAPATPQLARAVAGMNIIEAIREVPIFSHYMLCKDGLGNEVPGSIYSPVADSICISMQPLEGLSKYEARNQALALAAHEYSHLLNFNEVDARKLQEQVYELVSFESSVQIIDSLFDQSFYFGSLQGAGINYQKMPQAQKNWNSLCFVADKIYDYLSMLKIIDDFRQFSIFNLAEYQKAYAYYLKALALRNGACALSEDFPDRVSSQTYVKVWFGSEPQIMASDIAEFYSERPVDPTIKIRKISTIANFEAELKDITDYVDPILDYVNELKHFEAQTSWPLF